MPDLISNPSGCPSQHPSDAVLLSYTAGALELAHRLVIETHTMQCPACRATITLLDELGALAFAQAAPRPLPAAGVREYLTRSSAHMPASRRRRPPARLAGIVLPKPLDRLDPGPLRRVAPGLQQSTLWRGKRSTLHLVRVRAGTALPLHTHGGLELTCVLSGAFHDDTGRYTVGDVSEEDEATRLSGPEHSVAAEPPDYCVCIMATTGRLRFSGRLARLLQPIMPF